MFYDENLSESFVLTGSEGIENAVALHQKLVDKETIKKSGADISKDFGKIFSSLNIDNLVYTDYNCEIIYKLKDGRTIRRVYDASGECVDDEFRQLIITDEALNQLEPFNCNKEDLLFATLEEYRYDDEEGYYDESAGEIFNERLISIPDYDELFDTLKADYKEINKYNLFNCLYLGVYGFGYCDYEYMAETEYYIYIYYIEEDATPQQREALGNMSAAELQKLYNDYIHSDTYIENPPPISVYSVDVSDEHLGTIEYIERNFINN